MKKRNINGREIRTYTAIAPIEVRTTADGSKQLAGYAIRYNSPSQDLGGFTEVCSPGMCTRTLRESPERVRQFHAESEAGREQQSGPDAHQPEA